MIQSAQEFNALRTSRLPEEYERAAYEPAPMEVWEEIIATTPDMRGWVAHNKTVPLEILEVLARDEDSKVRFTVAMKRKLPEHLQLALARDPDSSVRHRIACNMKATREVLEILSGDSAEFVRDQARQALERMD